MPNSVRFPLCLMLGAGAGLLVGGAGHYWLAPLAGALAASVLALGLHFTAGWSDWGREPGRKRKV